MSFAVQDENGKVFNVVENPAAIVDIDTKILLKIGELEDMEFYCEFMKQRYLAVGFEAEANALIVIRLPEDQEEINNIFQSTSYVSKYVKLP